MTVLHLVEETGLGIGQERLPLVVTHGQRGIGIQRAAKHDPFMTRSNLDARSAFA